MAFYALTLGQELMTGVICIPAQDCKEDGVGQQHEQHVDLQL